MADFCGPSLPGGPDQDRQGRRPAFRDMAVEERQVSGVSQAAADQQPVPRRGGRGPRPGVVAVALAAGPARAGLPRLLRYQDRQGCHCGLPAGGQRDLEADRDREHVSLPRLLQGLAQLAAAAVDLIAGAERERHPGLDRACHHLRAQHGLGRELRRRRDHGAPTPPIVARPGFRQVEPEVEQRAGARGHVRHEDHALAVLHLAGDPGVLAGHPHGHGPFLQLRGLIQHHDRGGVTQVRQDEPLQPGKRRLPVPGVFRQQRLHPPRRGVPGHLAQLPARLTVTPLAQQRSDIPERSQTRSSLGEHRRDQRLQLSLELLQPAAAFYDGRDGHPLVL